MLKSLNSSKCAKVEYESDYKALSDGILNPYCYNFGRRAREVSREDYTKLHHIVNDNFFTKK